MAYLSKENAIPAMTSDTTPSGIASASSMFNSRIFAYLAFNRVQETSGWTSNTINPSWIQYEFPTPKLIRRYSMKSDGYPNRMAKDWTLLGSNDGVNWVTLDTRVNQTAWGANSVRYFDFNNNVDYKIYRINITANNGDTGAISLDEIEMFEYIYEYKALFLNDGKIKYFSQPYYSENLIPKMTSSQVPRGVVRASNETSSNYAAWLAFNEADNNCWQSTTEQCWISYMFVKPTIVSSYKLKSWSSVYGAYMPKSWTFEGSNDGVTWTILDEKKDVNPWTALEEREFVVKNRKEYLTYRLNISSAYNPRVFLCQFKMHYLNLSTLYEIDKANATENDFLTYGVNNEIITNVGFDKHNRTIFSHTPFASGKSFEHPIDLSKRRIKQITTSYQ
ncbi:discoidin domain-containing protein [Paenibacillus lautus]|uniref:discoidin domain-containing protein n=1 Tax=Paenibacillus lautus TaxID=1401 RepID=UPI003D28CFDB